MARNEMTPQQAALVLRMFEGMVSTSVRLNKDKSGETLNDIVNQLHEAVDMACTALVLWGDHSIEIDGGKDDGQ